MRRTRRADRPTSRKLTATSDPRTRSLREPRVVGNMLAGHSALGETFVPPSAGRRAVPVIMRPSYSPARGPRRVGGRVRVESSATGKETALGELAYDDAGASTSRSRIAKAALVVLAGGMAAQAGGYLSALPASGLLASAMCLNAWAKASLSLSGVAAAWWVFALTHYSSFIATAQLLAFFVSSSQFTKYKSQRKDKIMAENKKSGKRNWVQVLCNGTWPTLFVLLFGQSLAFRHAGMPLASGVGPWSVFLFGSCLGTWACCCGDTWASEIGVLSKAEPRLVTSLRRVPRGTNGGVSPLGLAASGFGGLFIGTVTYLMSILASGQGHYLQAAVKFLPFVLLGAVGGFAGSLVDSFLGATLQYSGFDTNLQKVVNSPGNERDGSVKRITGTDVLSNNQVNLLSSLIMGLCIGALSILFF